MSSWSTPADKQQATNSQATGHELMWSTPADKQQASGEKRQESHDGEEDSSQKYKVKDLKCMGEEEAGGTMHSTTHSTIHTTMPSSGEEAKKCQEKVHVSAHKRQKSRSRMNLRISRVSFGALEAFTSVEESLQVCVCVCVCVSGKSSLLPR